MLLLRAGRSCVQIKPISEKYMKPTGEITHNLKEITFLLSSIRPRGRPESDDRRSAIKTAMKQFLLNKRVIKLGCGGIIHQYFVCSFVHPWISSLIDH